ncbi:MAG TPA: hypothetical protein VEJ43_04520 [Pseudolabrys sp.]|nr:hypothetical protein [Pseudolabrys sp.]
MKGSKNEAISIAMILKQFMVVPLALILKQESLRQAWQISPLLGTSTLTRKSGLQRIKCGMVPARGGAFHFRHRM